MTKIFVRSCVSVLLITSLMALASNSYAASTLVAVATNFVVTAKQLKPVFERETGHQLTFSFASTGKLYTQIAHGAPYEVVLAADDVRPAMIEAAGLAVVGSRFTYAIGKLALCSVEAGLVDDGVILASGKRFNKLAIANPDTAPYGAAAVEVLQALGVYPQLKSQLVRGDSVAQAYQFVATGNAALGFVALSQAIHNPVVSIWRVPDGLYTPLKQDAVLLVRGAGNPAAQAFMAFLKTEQARAIIESYGYGLELP